MRKILLGIVAVFIAFLIIPTVNAAEKVKVYVFSKEGCSACQTAFNYFDSLEEEYPDLFELIVFEVWDEKGNSNGDDLVNLIVYTYSYFDADTTNAGTPTIVIGDYFTVGFPVDSDDIYNAIVAEAEAEEKTDIIGELASTLSINIDEIRYKETEDTTSNDILIIAGILIIVVGATAGLIYVSKKNYK